MKDKMMTPAIIGGIVLAGGSVLPIIKALNCLCCAWLVAGGATAAYLYIRESPQKVTTGDGAILGALAGVTGSLFHTVLAIPFRMILPARNLESVRAALDRPEIPEGVRDLITSMMGSRGFSIIGMFVGFFAMLVFALIFSTLGGIIGVAIFEKRKNGQVIPPPPPPVPPIGPPPAL
ncbi:MAG TPA: hypothetical protein VGQ81_06965 [Acidobacteriota bacterium]|nr:hypothetical protein [Acidobacteriota bacterium]